MGFKTHEQVGKECRAKMRRMIARRASNCPQCKRPIAIGDTIVSPWAPNSHRDNRFHGCWYCGDCGEHVQRGVDCGYLAIIAPFLTLADSQAFESRPDVVAWLEECRQRKAAGLDP